MAGALVAQARGPLVIVLVPEGSGPGTDAPLTKNVPPSPKELGKTISAAPSFCRKERNRWERPRGLGLAPASLVEPTREILVAPAFANRRRLVSIMRNAMGSNAGLRSRIGPERTIAPFSLPEYF